jgi:hypothetical protein
MLAWGSCKQVPVCFSLLLLLPYVLCVELQIVDSLDTLLLAGLTEEYQQARHWVANHLVFPDNHNVQFFEVNIRILGGLLSAYYLSDGDDLYLHKAQQLADRCSISANLVCAPCASLIESAGELQQLCVCVIHDDRGPV